MTHNARTDYTAGGFLCRCPESDRTGDWGNVKVKEQGRGALHVECQRGRFEDERCNDQTYEFYSPTSVTRKDELSMKLAILHGGPITASINTYGKLLDDHDDKNGEAVFSGRAADHASRTGGHAIVVFGWGTTRRGVPFWWARNTWGSEWPKNAQTPGIFKLHRGTNQNDIEGGETVFSMVSSIPGVGNVRSAFTTKTCEAMNPDRTTDVLSCVKITNQENQCVLKNTCEETVTVTRATQNNLATKSNRDQCGKKLEGTALQPNKDTRFEMLVDCCVLEATKARAAASCVKRDTEQLCEFENKCTQAIAVEATSPRLRTNMGVVKSDDSALFPHKFCDKTQYQIKTMTEDRSRTVDASVCFTVKTHERCSITNDCGVAMKLLRRDGSWTYTMNLMKRKTATNMEWCGPGIESEKM